MARHSTADRLKPTPPPRAVSCGAALRGIYLWAGSATVELQRVKFPDRPVDVDAHHFAHSEIAARELANRGFNWAFLSMNWGFPPEVEGTHWAEFQSALAAYHAAGLTVIGYVQASNCVAAGSYATRDWYARTPDGRTIPYYTNRRMTCWNAHEWLTEVTAHALRAIDFGADGVFFDNLWMGATPWVLAGRVGGFAGCACVRCARAFAEATGGATIPRSLCNDAASMRYLEWRSAVVAQRLGEWAERVQSRNPQAIVLSNSCDVVLRDTRALFGLDLEKTGRLQNMLLVENIAMPRHEPGARRLISNAITLRGVRALVPGRRVLAVTYEHGIGLDRIPSAGRLLRALAESAALGASPIVKGSEYLDERGRFSVLTAPSFQSIREAVAPMLSWLGENTALFEDVEPDPAVFVLYDAERMLDQWSDTAPATFALAQSLLVEGVPFAFVTPAQLANGATAERLVFVPPGVAMPAERGRAALLPVPKGVIDVPGAPSSLWSSPLARRLVSPLLSTISSAYFGSARVRRTFDLLGITARFLRSPFFAVPRRSEAAGPLLPAACPRFDADGPILVERWRRQAGGRRFVHIVNLGDDPVTVTLPAAMIALRMHTPDGETRLTRRAGRTALQLEVYAVIETSGTV